MVGVIGGIGVTKAFLSIVVVLFPFFFKHYLEIQPIGSSHLQITVPVHVKLRGPGFRFPDLIEATQVQIDEETKNMFSPNWRFLLVDEINGPEVSSDSSDESKYTVEMIYDEKDTVGLDSSNLLAYMSYSLKTIHSNDLPFNLAQVVLYHLMVAEKAMVDSDLVDGLSLRFVLEGEHKLLQPAIELYVGNYAGIIPIVVSYHDTVPEIYRDTVPPGYKDCTIYIGSQYHGGNENIIVIDDSNPMDLVRDIIENKLNFPAHPSNNLVLKLNGYKRLKTLENLHMAQERAVDTGKLVEEIGTNPRGDWFIYLEKSRALL
jgi:hypothetical protein